MRFSIYPRAVLHNEIDRKGAVTSIDAAVHRIRTGEKGLAENTEKLRELLSKGKKDTYKKRKAQILPAATFSGIFSTRDRDVPLAEKFTEHNGTRTYDIDGIKRNHIGAIKTELSLQPYIFLVFISPSYEGLKAFERTYPVPTTANDLEHKYVWALGKARLDQTLSHYGYQCDSGDDPTRLCFLSHDPDVYYDPSKPIGTWDRDAYHIETQRQEREQSQARQQPRTELEKRQWNNTEIDPRALNFIDPDGIHYDDWFRVIAACKASGLSWQDVDQWSSRGTKHQDGDIEKRWDGINTTDLSWGTVIYFAQQGGYQLPQRNRPPKLQNANSPPPRGVSEQARPEKPTSDATLETLDENRAARETATETFFTDASDETLHILLIKDATGTGKTHTTLAKSKAHDKRTIMNAPHNALAAQAVETAREQGYENPFHILGREHNWDESGIADIPVAERTADLFDRNNCIMVDQIKAYTDKRLAPRTYCEHKCPFREGCPHLAQYKGLAQRDFIVNCTPNLLFDLNMRSYLESLVNATEEVSDEELAIDAMLGTETDAPKAFDFAKLDDYSVSSLYTDVILSQSEFKTLKKVWDGTPTGDFAKRILKAFEKKNPHKIVKALRKAFESTADHHKSIAKALTQHARQGTIEYAEHPKSSDESKRLLTEKVVKYDDGRQFIPVDFDAYKELKSKDIPCVHPQHLTTTSVGETVCVPHAPVEALISGVPVDKLTPVWQNGATPIDLIRIFLDSIGDDRHAPIRRTFRNGDPPVAILTFSVPPQAPVGIIPQIAMLSATSDIEDTQRSFDRQAVTFSEHTGGDLQWASGVQVYQYPDARLTSASVFEYPVDDDDKRLLQSEPTGLTPTAEKRISKLNDWAKQVNGLTAFISYKDIAEQFSEHVDGFDVLTHFDKVAGLNFEGLKYLVVFGYPKVKHEIVMEHARKIFVSDHQQLPKGAYDELTEVDEYQENGITITERRYKDPRLEKIRHQLSTEKLEQAIGRARHPRWTDTTTVIFTNAPVNATPRATLFTDAAFKLSETPNDIPNAIATINDAEQRGDVQAVMETQDVSQRTAERRTKASRDQKNAERDKRIIELHRADKSKREIERILKSENFKVSYRTIGDVIECCLNVNAYKYIPIGDDAKAAAPENVDEPCEEQTSGEKNTNGHHRVPRSEYSRLFESEARAELQHCTKTSDYAGASLLRSLFRKRCWSIETNKTGTRYLTSHNP